MIVQKWGAGGIAILAVICVFAVVFALFIVPALARSLSVDRTVLGFVLAGVFFVVAVVCLSAAKKMSKKQP